MFVLIWVAKVLICRNARNEQYERGQIFLRSCYRASWQYVNVTAHRDNTLMWPCNVTIRSCDSASWQYVHVTVHRDNKFVWPCCIVTNFFVIKPTGCTNFTNLFWHETLHVSDSSSVHHQEFIHCTLSNGICHTACEQDLHRTEFHRGTVLASCVQTCMTYTIAEYTVNKLLMMDRRTVRNM
jgi:UDP-N-acetylglucosamine 2-epimerase